LIEPLACSFDALLGATEVYGACRRDCRISRRALPQALRLLEALGRTLVIEMAADPFGAEAIERVIVNRVACHPPAIMRLAPWARAASGFARGPKAASAGRCDVGTGPRAARHDATRRTDGGSEIARRARNSLEKLEPWAAKLAAAAARLIRRSP